MILLILTPIITVKLYPRKEKITFGSEEIKVYNCANNVIMTVKTEEYIAGVVAAEMPADFHTEALKAQAVAARTYLVEKGSCSNHPEANICTDSTHCQAYKSVDELKKQWGEDFAKNYTKISSAVVATSGEIILYDGEPISAVFHSTSSGRTEDSEDVWGSSRPYLKSVDSSVDENSPKYASSKTVSLDRFKEIIKEARSSADFNKSLISDVVTTDGGSVNTVKIGGETFKGTEIRKLFDLDSANFVIDVADSDVIFDVRGYGHGVGMSQYGANFMAIDGSDYIEILKKYYTDVRIEKNF